TPSTTRSNISDGPKVCTISACELNIMVWWKVCGDWLRSVSSTPLKRWITITPVYAVALKQVYVSAVVYQCGADAAVSPTVEIFVEQCDGYRTGGGGSHNVMADLHCRCTNGAYCREFFRRNATFWAHPNVQRVELRQRSGGLGDAVVAFFM